MARRGCLGPLGSQDLVLPGPSQDHEADRVRDRLVAFVVKDLNQPLRLLVGQVALARLLRIAGDLPGWVVVAQAPADGAVHH